jgi:hypothetical protein
VYATAFIYSGWTAAGVTGFAKVAPSVVQIGIDAVGRIVQKRHGLIL